MSGIAAWVRAHRPGGAFHGWIPGDTVPFGEVESRTSEIKEKKNEWFKSYGSFLGKREDRLGKVAYAISGMAGISLLVILCVGAAGAGPLANTSTLSWCVVGLSGVGLIGVLGSYHLKNRKAIPIVLTTLLMGAGLLALGLLGGTHVMGGTLLPKLFLVVDLVGCVFIVAVVSFNQGFKTLLDKRRLPEEEGDTLPKDYYERMQELYQSSGFVQCKTRAERDAQIARNNERWRPDRERRRATARLWVEQLRQRSANAAAPSAST